MWTMVLEDGSRHPVSGDVRFKVVGTSKLMTGSLDLTYALFDAIVERAVMLVSDHGRVFWVRVTSIDARGATIEGVDRPHD